MPRVKVPVPRRPARRRPAGGLWVWPPSPRVIRLSLFIAGVAVGTAPLIYAWRVGIPQPVSETFAVVAARSAATTASAGLTVEEIFVEGRNETSAAHVLSVLDVKRGSPILAFSPARAKAALELLPWVREAAVERRLPNTIHVRLVERKPLALWQRHGKLILIDRDGAEIRGVDPSRFAHLLVVVGEDAPQHASRFLALLATEPELEKRVTAAVRVGGRRWNVRLGAGEGADTIDVQLPEVNAGAAWTRLAELARDKKLFERNVAGVDLRLPDRLIVRVIRQTPPATAPASRNSRAPGRPT